MSGTGTSRRRGKLRTAAYAAITIAIAPFLVIGVIGSIIGEHHK